MIGAFLGFAEKKPHFCGIDMTEISKSLFIEEYEMVSEEYEFAREEYEYGYFWGNSPEFQDVLLMEEILHQLICSLSHCLRGFTHPGGAGFLPSTVGRI